MRNSFLWVQAHSCAVTPSPLVVGIDCIHAGERDLDVHDRCKVKI
jgi:hypothetical protein